MRISGIEGFGRYGRRPESGRTRFLTSVSQQDTVHDYMQTSVQDSIRKPQSPMYDTVSGQEP